MSTSDFGDVFVAGDEAEEAAPLAEITERIAAQTNTSSRMLIAIVAAIGAVLLFLIGLVFYRMIATGQSAATGISSRESASAAAVADASEDSEADEASEGEGGAGGEAEEPSMSLDEAREKLANLTASSACQGEDDAQFLSDFAKLSEEAGQWDADRAEVNARLSELPGRCGEVYAGNLANRLRSASTPDGLAELVDTTLAYVGADKRPAPEGAIDIASFSAPSRNIQCQIGEDLSCTIYEYEYAAEACQGAPTTYSIAGGGESSQSCGRQMTSDTVVSYGTTIARSGYACTVGEEGVECWFTKTGKGFRISRTSVSTF